MKMQCDVIYRVEFTPKEFGLISRALRGRLRDEEKQDAIGLQRAMVEQKVSHFDHIAGEIDKLRKNLEEAVAGG